MKTVLVATDFSPAARNASLFAAKLCQDVNARMVLFHSYRIPIPAGEGSFVNIDMANVEEDVAELMKKEAAMLLLETGLKAEIRLAPGFAVEEIAQLQESLNADLVVMGIAHASVVSEYLLGSTTTSFIRQTRTPVLAIPPEAGYFRPRKIVYACDYSDSNSEAVLSPLTEMANLFDSRIYILNVLDKPGDFPLEKSITGLNIDDYLKPVNHIYYFPEDENVVDGIEYFVSTHGINWVVMVPHKHKWYDRLLNKSTSKKVVFHSHLPVLLLPEASWSGK